MKLFDISRGRAETNLGLCTWRVAKIWILYEFYMDFNKNAHSRSTSNLLKCFHWSFCLHILNFNSFGSATTKKMRSKELSIIVRSCIVRSRKEKFQTFWTKSYSNKFYSYLSGRFHKLSIFLYIKGEPNLSVLHPSSHPPLNSPINKHLCTRGWSTAYQGISFLANY